MKPHNLLLWSSLLLVALPPASAHAGLTCDLNTGALNGLQIGRLADAKAIASAMGTEPGFVDDNFPGSTGYLFPGLGAEVTTFEDDAGEVVSSLAVHYTAGQDFYGAPVARYQGGFVPALGQHETVSSIKEKLGVPAKEYLPAPGVTEPSLLVFRRPFGKMTFLFGVDGALRHITLDKLGPGDEGWTAPPQKSGPADDVWMQKVVFRDGVEPSVEAPLAAKPWTAQEKREALAVLAGIRAREAGLTDRVVGYRPLSLYRARRIGAESADALTVQGMQAVFLGDSFFGFNAAGMTRILTHELAHLADAFGRHSGDPAWLRLTEEARSRVVRHFQGLGLSVHKAALASKGEYEEVAKKEGFFSLWSCLSPSETLADAAADQSLGRSPRLPGVDDFVRRRLLGAFLPDPWEESMHSGAAAMGSGKWDAAIEAFSAAALSEPTQGIAFLFRAEAWEKKGELGRAAADLDRAVDGNAGSEATLRRAKLRLKNQETGKAVSDLTEYIKAVPWMERGYELRAAAYRTLGDTERAIQDYSALLELAPGNMQAVGRRGDLHYARKDYDKAIADFSLVILKDPANAMAATLRRGRCWLGKSDPERALADLEAVLKAEPRNWNALGLLMETSFARGDHARVITEAQGIIKLNAKNVFARLMLGRSLAATQRWEEAVAEFGRVIELDPRNFDAYVARAKAHERLDSPFHPSAGLAAEDYASAISLSTGNARLYYEKGLASRKAGMPNAAQDSFYKAASLSPQTVEYHIAKAEAELGLWLHDKSTNWVDSASASIGTALRLAPENEDAKRLAARIESERKGSRTEP
ncbi:MAG: tetratricopeptide repeat protein [Elusimicrobia bacterium]|nr:tetratricopeptide repeat protein [Elusimicrobiota bacterium]